MTAGAVVVGEDSMLLALEACQFCGESGFDAMGLASHVRTHCEVVERLYEQQIVSLQEWHTKMAEAAFRKAKGERKGE